MSDDTYMIIDLKTGACLDSPSKKEKPEDALKKAHEKFVGGPMPEMTYGLVTIACGDLCLMK